MQQKFLQVLLILALPLSLLGLTLAPSLAAAEKYYSEDGRFKIAFEGEPRDFHQDQDSEFGKMTWYAYAYQSLDYLAIILYCDLPKSMTLGFNSQALLKQVGEGMADSDAVIVSQNPVNVSGTEGLEFITAKNNEYTRRIFLMAGQRIYIFGVETTQDLIDSDQVVDFLNSFELVTE